MNKTKDKLIEQGYTWEEAEELMDHYAEERRDDEIDRQLTQGESDAEH